MKKQVLVFLFLFPVIVPAFSQKALSTWVSPEYTKPEYRKVAVLVLRDKGANAITSYLNFKEVDLASTEALIARADQLQVDAVDVFSVLREDTKIQNTPTISAGVAIPVRIGFFTAYLGGNVPLAGGPKFVDVLQLKSEFYNRNSEAPHWNAVYEFKLKNNYEAIAKCCTTQAIASLLRAKIL